MYSLRLEKEEKKFELVVEINDTSVLHLPNYQS